MSLYNNFQCRHTNYLVPQLTPDMPLLPYHKVENNNQDVFVVTNEEGQGEILETFKTLGSEIARKVDSIQGRVNVNKIGYIGCSGLLNLNFVAACDGERSIDHITIIDNSRAVEQFWKRTAKFIKKLDPNDSRCPEKLILHFKGEIEKRPIKMNQISNAISFFYKEIKDIHSFASHPIKFRKIYDIFKNNNFTFKFLDLANYSEVQKLIQSQMNQGIVPFVFYISNIIAQNKSPCFDCDNHYHSVGHLNLQTSLKQIAGLPQDPIVIWSDLDPSYPSLHLSLSALKVHDTIMGSMSTYVVNNNKPDEIELFLKHGVNPNMPFHHHGSLFFAALNKDNSIEYIQQMLNYKADVNIKRDDNWAPIHVAADHPNPNVIGLLAEYKADVNAQDHDLETPLLRALYQRKIPNAHALLDVKANPDIPDVNGFTPFSIALLLSVFSSNPNAPIHELVKRMDPDPEQIDEKNSDDEEWTWV